MLSKENHKHTVRMTQVKYPLQLTDLLLEK